MKKLVSRVFRNGEVIGYQVMHEGETFSTMTKAQVHALAKSGLIENVKALSDGGLTGINGFKIKELSAAYLKDDESANKITGNHLLAFAARLILNKHNKAKSYDIIKVASYLKSKNIYEIDGHSISTENSLGNSLSVIGHTIQINASLDDYTYDDVDSIIIGNISNIPITILRLPYATLDFTPEVVEPGCKICISKAEFGLLAINQAVNLKFSNCKTMVLSFTEKDNYCINPLYNMLEHFKPVKFTNGYETVYTETEVYPCDLDTYFGNYNKIPNNNKVDTKNEKVKRNNWLSIFK